MGNESYKDLQNNKLDIIISGNVGDTEDEGIRLYSEPLVWIGSKDHRTEEEHLNIIQMSAPCSYRKAAIESLNSIGITWYEEVTVNNIQGVISAVSAGFGISTEPKSAVGENIEVLNDNLPDLPETSVHIYWNRTNPHPLTQRFIDIIQEEMKKTGLF